MWSTTSQQGQTDLWTSEPCLESWFYFQLSFYYGFVLDLFFSVVKVHSSVLFSSHIERWRFKLTISNHSQKQWCNHSGRQLSRKIIHKWTPMNRQMLKNKKLINNQFQHNNITNILVLVPWLCCIIVKYLLKEQSFPLLIPKPNNVFIVIRWFLINLFILDTYLYVIYRLLVIFLFTIIYLYEARKGHCLTDWLSDKL